MKKQDEFSKILELDKEDVAVLSDKGIAGLYGGTAPETKDSVCITMECGKHTSFRLEMEER